MATNTTDSQPRLARALPYILVVGGLVGLYCSFVLSVDELHVLKDPTFQPGCNLNPIISCGSVMTSWQSSAFGFPNSWIGLIAFSTFVALGMAMLAGAKFKRWFWIGLEIASMSGAVFALWMLFQSVYSIGALCPYCLTTDAAMLTLFWYLTLYNLREEHVKLPPRMIGMGDFARRYHFEILLVTFLVLSAFIVKHFWYYYSQYL